MSNVTPTSGLINVSAMSIALLVMSCVMMCLTASLPAAAPEPTVLADLGSEDYHVRQRATQKLLADDSLRPQDLVSLYEQAHHEEQRQRLLAVARHHLLRTLAHDPQNFPTAAPGAIGLARDAIGADQMPLVERSAVRVAHTFAGFPAYALLQRDDLILAIDGQELPRTPDVSLTFQAFTELIKTHQTDGIVTLTLWRDGRKLDVSMKLGNSIALNDMYRVTTVNAPVTLGDVWESHWLVARQSLFHSAADADPPLTLDQTPVSP